MPGEGAPTPSLFLCAGDKIGKAFPLLMAAVNPPSQWITDQVLVPIDPVDLFVLSDDLTTANPTSAPPTEPEPEEPDTTSGGGGTDTVSTKSTKSKK